MLKMKIFEKQQYKSRQLCKRYLFIKNMFYKNKKRDSQGFNTECPEFHVQHFKHPENSLL